MATFENEYVKIWDEGGIGHVVFKEIDDIDYDKARAYISECVKATGPVKMAVMIDVRKVRGITPQATKYLASDEVDKLTKAVAMVVNPMSQLVSMGISVLVKLGGEPYPIKFFNDDVEALEWLKQFVDKPGSTDVNNANAKQ